jgi:hypothetical protein
MMEDAMSEAEIITQLECALNDAYEALTWHGGLQFQPDGRDGEVIKNIIIDALNEVRHERA